MTKKLYKSGYKMCVFKLMLYFMESQISFLLKFTIIILADFSLENVLITLEFVCENQQTRLKLKNSFGFLHW